MHQELWTPSKQTSSGRAPDSILIVGAGVYGLSTFVSLLSNAAYDQTALTLLDTHLPTLSSRDDSGTATENCLLAQNPNAASIDSSRIIRFDYANPAYTRLAREAQVKWREGYGCCLAYGHIEGKHAGNGQDGGRCQIRGCDHSPVYSQSGLLLTGEKTGVKYVERSQRNAESLAADVQPLRGATEISKVLDEGRYDSGKQRSNRARGSGNNFLEAGRTDLGETGYVNWSCGWADNARAMANVMAGALSASTMRNRTTGKGKVNFIQGKASCLLFCSLSTPSAPSIPVEGVRYLPSSSSLPPSIPASPPAGVEVRADLTILATGAHTSSFLDFRSKVQATAQILSYIPLSRAEASALAHRPVIFNLSNGFFAIPPSFPSPSPASNAPLDRPYTLKIARHSHGYVNPTLVDLPASFEKSSSSGAPSAPRAMTMAPSVPGQTFSPIPDSDITSCVRFLHTLLPSPPNPALSRLYPSSPFSSPAHDLVSSTRLCFYTDTPTGNFLITYHPSHPNLLLATGGSGHGFKFLPVLGDHVVKVLEGRKDVDPGLGWSWDAHEQRNEEIVKAKSGGGYEWTTEDGSRNGESGVRLSDALAVKADQAVGIGMGVRSRL